MRRVVFWSLLLATTFALVGCKAKYKNEMEDVAKKWSQTIRASQVIPVYPLEENIRPGDIFLVEKPSIQKDLYQGGGFLPMDTHLGRLNDLENKYKEFYGENHLGVYPASLKSTTQSPNTVPVSLKECYTDKTGYDQVLCLLDKQAKMKSKSAMHWPQAVFPSYSVDVGVDGSLGLGISLKGIPLGLSLLHSSKATAVVSIKDAYSVGLPITMLYGEVQKWADQKENDELLWEYSESHEDILYIRVVTKVFLAQQFDVALLRSSETGGKFKVFGGEDEPAPSEDTPSSNMQESLTQLVMQNMVTAAAEAMPKGQVSVTGRSAMGVSLRETLPRPVVLGIHAVDIPVLDGQLGAPIATQSYLLRDVKHKPVKVRVDEELDKFSEARDTVNMLSDGCKLKFMRALVKEAPDDYSAVALALKTLNEGNYATGIPKNDEVLKALNEVSFGVVEPVTGNVVFKAYKDITDTNIADAFNSDVEMRLEKMRRMRAEHETALRVASTNCS